MPTACNEGTVMANQGNLKQLNDREKATILSVMQSRAVQAVQTALSYRRQAKNLTLRLHIGSVRPYFGLGKCSVTVCNICVLS